MEQRAAVALGLGVGLGVALALAWRRLRSDYATTTPPTPTGDVTPMPVGPKTQYILSTSGRPSSMRRYKALLRDVLGMDVAYLVIHCGDDSASGKIEAANFVAALRGLRAIGGAISKDIKGTVVPLLDDVEPLAKRIGAVNTVVRRGDCLCGYNTDAAGFEQAIRRAIDEADDRKVTSAVVYGYGGVTAVVVNVLQHMGLEVFITGRRPDAAARRAAELSCETFDPARHRPVLFVNAAPVTDSPDLAAVPNFLAALKSCTLAFDHEMPGASLVAYCHERGIKHVPGTAMYWPQMEAQWRLFLDGRLPHAQLGDLPALLRQADEQSKA